MTVTTTNVRNVLTGNGVATAFAFTFRFLSASTVQVFRNMPGATPTLVPTSAYTLTPGVGNVGGTVTFTTAPANTEVITIQRTVPLTQSVDINNEDGFFPDVVENGLDAVTLAIQQVRDQSAASGGLQVVGGMDATLRQVRDVNGVTAPMRLSSTEVAIDATRATGGTVLRSLGDHLAANIVLPNYASSTDAMNTVPASGSGVIVVPRGVAFTPVSQSGKIITWDAQSTDSRAVLDASGTRTGGFFSDYDCQGARVLISQMRQDQTAIAGGGFRDLLFCNVVDSDEANYTAIGQKVTMAVRGLATGAVVGGVFQRQYKDIVGADFHAIGRIDWPARGVSGIATGAIQYGRGITSNEFSAQNPEFANEQSESMAAVQAILRAHKGDAGPSHLAYAVIAESNQSKLATAGVVVISTPHATDPTRDGAYMYGLDLGRASVRDVAIRMPASRAGSAGTIIEYDPNDYSFFDRLNNRFAWVVGGGIGLFADGNGIGVGTAPDATARLTLAAGTAAVAPLLMPAGVAPTSPVNGQMWFNGTNLFFRAAGVTRTITWT